MKDKGYHQDNTSLMKKLFIGFPMIAFPAWSFYHRNQYPNNYRGIIICTIGYILLSIVYMIYERFIEKMMFFHGYGSGVIYNI